MSRQSEERKKGICTINNLPNPIMSHNLTLSLRGQVNKHNTLQSLLIYMCVFSTPSHVHTEQMRDVAHNDLNGN